MQKNSIYGLATATLVFTTSLLAQDLAKEALASFPLQTIRLEYSSPARLRTLPNYASLRQRYLGSRLLTLENSLSKLGIHEGDINELLLGWEPGKPQMELYGFAKGNFDAKAIRDGEAALGLPPTPIAGQQAYCVEAGLAATCVIVLGGSHGVFGTFGVLNALMDARAGRSPALGSEERIAKLVNEAARTQAPIWGVAVGQAVSDWFQGWMPSQDSLQLDWSRTFGTVEALAYSVQPKDKVGLDVKLDCASAEAAASLRQVLEGVRLFQTVAWQNKNPSRPNPFESLDVALKDRRIDLSLITAYDAIETP